MHTLRHQEALFSLVKQVMMFKLGPGRMENAVYIISGQILLVNYKLGLSNVTKTVRAGIDTSTQSKI